MKHRHLLGWIVILNALIAPAIAHNVEVAGDIAGTWHIDPDHNPRSGEPARVWIALTRRGGQILPLNEADCTLRAYTAPRTESSQPVLNPALQSIAVEQYQGIPSADVVFPKPGLYQLELGCTPKAADAFEPFQLKYDVTVTQGSVAATPSPNATSLPEPAASAVPTQPESSNSFAQTIVPIVFGVLLGAGVLAILWRNSKR